MEKLKTEFNPRVVRALMALHNETQEDLAKALGYSRSHIAPVLTEKRNCTKELAERIAKHYNVKVSIFFTQCGAN